MTKRKTLLAGILLAMATVCVTSQAGVTVGIGVGVPGPYYYPRYRPYYYRPYGYGVYVAPGAASLLRACSGLSGASLRSASLPSARQRCARLPSGDASAAAILLRTNCAGPDTRSATANLCTGNRSAACCASARFGLKPVATAS